MIKQTAQSAKKLAQQIAKQAAQEPLEILKTAREQTFSPEVPGPGPSENESKMVEAQGKIDEGRKLQDSMKSGRRMEALNRELDDIRKQDLFKDLQRRITEGEEIPLGDYPELSPEQIQVLKAQAEAFRAQRQNIQGQNEAGLAEPAAKKGRQLFSFGKKTAVKREQTHIEKPVPPSG